MLQNNVDDDEAFARRLHLEELQRALMANHAFQHQPAAQAAPPNPRQILNIAAGPNGSEHPSFEIWKTIYFFIEAVISTAILAINWNVDGCPYLKYWLLVF